jgi:O-antigen/teichoic acid export membrane protein
MSEELSKLTMIIFSFFCLQIVFKTINTVLMADQRPAVSSFINTISQIIILGIIYVLTKTSDGSLLSLGWVLSGVPLVVLLLATIYFYLNDYKYLMPKIKFVDFKYAKDIVKLGFNFFLIQISVIVIYQTNNIIIAQVGSPEDVTVFNVAYKYISLALMIFTIIVAPFWSAFTEAYTKNDFLWMKSTVKKLRIISYFLILFLIVLVFTANTFYEFWVGDSVFISTKITIIVAIYVAMLIIVSLNTQVLNGIGKIKVQLITYSFSTIFHIPLALFLGDRFGIMGVLSSAIFFYIIIATFSVFQVNHLLKGYKKGLWGK